MRSPSPLVERGRGEGKSGGTVTGKTIVLLVCHPEGVYTQNKFYESSVEERIDACGMTNSIVEHSSRCPPLSCTCGMERGRGEVKKKDAYGHPFWFSCQRSLSEL